MIFVKFYADFCHIARKILSFFLLCKYAVAFATALLFTGLPCCARNESEYVKTSVSAV